MFRHLKLATTKNMAPIDTPRHSDIWLKGKQSPHPNHFRRGGIDPCKVLEPKRKTLQSLEAERIMTVFQDTVKRMEITTALPYILKSLPRFSVIFGQELTSHLSGHLQMQNAYKEALAELAKNTEQDNELERRKGTETKPNVGSNDVKVIIECPRIKISSPDELYARDVLEQEVEFLAQGIKCSLKEILRFFKKNPKAIEIITGE